jgi:propanol-preferring alcohol dehydrogenase
MRPMHWRSLRKAAGQPILSVIDLVGNAQTTQLGFDVLSKGGKLIMVGLFGGGATWALPLIAMKALTIQGSYVGNLRETKELLELVRTKKVQPIPDADAVRQGECGAERSERRQDWWAASILTPA